jgi:hypothetical protein
VQLIAETADCVLDELLHFIQPHTNASDKSATIARNG